MDKYSCHLQNNQQVTNKLVNYVQNKTQQLIFISPKLMEKYVVMIN